MIMAPALESENRVILSATGKKSWLQSAHHEPTPLYLGKERISLFITSFLKKILYTQFKYWSCSEGKWVASRVDLIMHSALLPLAICYFVRSSKVTCRVNHTSHSILIKSIQRKGPDSFWECKTFALWFSNDSSAMHQLQIWVMV